MDTKSVVCDVIWIGWILAVVFFFLLDSAVSIQQRWERSSVDVFSPLLFSRVPGWQAIRIHGVRSRVFF